jgi:hypothetical protein
VTPKGNATELIKKYTKANGKYLFIFIAVITAGSFRIYDRKRMVAWDPYKATKYIYHAIIKHASNPEKYDIRKANAIHTF